MEVARYTFFPHSATKQPSFSRRGVDNPHTYIGVIASCFSEDCLRITIDKHNVLLATDIILAMKTLHQYKCVGITH